MTYRHAFAKWLGSASLVLTMAGCPAGDDGETGATSLPLPTTGSMETDSPTSTTGEEPSTGTPGTTVAMEDSTTGSVDTSGGVTCDPPCEPGQECIGGACFDMPMETTTGDPPPPTNSDYGPCDSCAAGEIPVMVGMIDGCFCSPACDGQGSMCAAPNEGTAMPVCALELMMGAGPTQCVLVCMDAADCPPGATCEDAGGASICMHPAP